MREQAEHIGLWRIISRRAAYENRWIQVEHHDVVQPDGEPGVYGVVRFANLAVGVLPLFADGTVPLVGQHRFPLDRYSWELPEGGGPAGEEPEVTARRELVEETGLQAGGLFRMGDAYLSNAVTDERATMFLAWDLTTGTANPDGDEVLSHRRLPLSEVLKEIFEGRIDDALTILTVQSAVTQAMAGRLPERVAAIVRPQLKAMLATRA